MPLSASQFVYNTPPENLSQFPHPCTYNASTQGSSQQVGVYLESYSGSTQSLSHHTPILTSTGILSQVPSPPNTNASFHLGTDHSTLPIPHNNNQTQCYYLHRISIIAHSQDTHFQKFPRETEKKEEKCSSAKVSLSKIVRKISSRQSALSRRGVFRAKWTW